MKGIRTTTESERWLCRRHYGRSHADRGSNRGIMFRSSILSAASQLRVSIALSDTLQPLQGRTHDSKKIHKEPPRGGINTRRASSAFIAVLVTQNADSHALSRGKFWDPLHLQMQLTSFKSHGGSASVRLEAHVATSTAYQEGLMISHACVPHIYGGDATRGGKRYQASIFSQPWTSTTVANHTYSFLAHSRALSVIPNATEGADSL